MINENLNQKEKNTGILLRRNIKSFFEENINRPIFGEIVYAIDTQEIGMLTKDLNNNDYIKWVPFEGVVQSVFGRKGNVIVTKKDLNLENVDNTADLDKPISNLVRVELDNHYNAKNPHKITKKDLNLENVDNTADLDKPISNLVRVELDKKISWSELRNLVQGEPKFTDTTYEIKDGELSEFNFNAVYKAFIDNFNFNNRVLPPNQALAVNGYSLTLFRADGSSETIELPHNENVQVPQINNSIVNIEDNLISNSIENALSANQGRILNESLNEIKRLIDVNENDFNTLNNIIQFIDSNRDSLNQLSIENIFGLEKALNSKVNKGSDINTAPNADKLQGLSKDAFVLSSEYLSKILEFSNKITVIEAQIRNFITFEESNQRLQDSLNNLNLPEQIQNIINEINALKSFVSSFNVNILNNELQLAKQSLETQFNNLKENVNNKVTNLNAKIESFNKEALLNEINVLKNNCTRLENENEFLTTTITDIKTLLINMTNVQNFEELKDLIEEAVQINSF